jgi:hypothetical protein
MREKIIVAAMIILVGLTFINISSTTAQKRLRPGEVINPITKQPDAQSTSGNPATRCITDDDCSIKTTYNCCGAVPRCFNKDYEVPSREKIMKECKEKDLVSTCGFIEIQGCECQNAECIGIPKEQDS